MRRLKRELLFLLMVVTLIGGSALAYYNTISWNGKLENGVKSMGYYINSNCEYTVSIPKAIENWTYPGWSNPINMYSVTKANSNMDFIQVYEPTSNSNAYTMLFKKGGVLVKINDLMNGFSWRYGEIRLNEAKMGTRSSEDNVATIIHEMGHVFGLRDIKNEYSIMHFNDQKKVKKVTKDANDAVVSKY